MTVSTKKKRKRSKKDSSLTMDSLLVNSRPSAKARNKGCKNQQTKGIPCNPMGKNVYCERTAKDQIDSAGLLKSRLVATTNSSSKK